MLAGSAGIERASQDAHPVLGADAEPQRRRPARGVEPHRARHAVVVQALVVDPVAWGENPEGIEVPARGMGPVVVVEELRAIRLPRGEAQPALVHVAADVERKLSDACPGATRSEPGAPVARTLTRYSYAAPGRRSRPADRLSP